MDIRDINVNCFVKAVYEGKTTIRRVAEINSEEGKVRLVDIDTWFDKDNIMPLVKVGDRVVVDFADLNGRHRVVTVEAISGDSFRGVNSVGSTSWYNMINNGHCNVMPLEEPTEDMSPLETFLTKYGVAYSPEVVTKIEKDAYEAKASLREKFSKHPNWDEKRQAIVMEEEVEIPVDRSLAASIAKNIGYEYNSDVATFVSEVITYNTIRGLVYLGDRGISVLNIITNSSYESYHQGMKVTRFLRSLFEHFNINRTFTNFEKEYAKLADAISVRKIKRTFVLSLNLLDFMSMSHGNSWTSCHSVENYGEYHGGCMSYALDNSTAIMYTLEGNVDDNVDLWTIPKVTRQLFMFDDGWMIQSRCYPDYTNAATANMHADFVLPIYEELWGKVEEVEVNTCAVNTFCCRYTSTYGLHYPDYTYNYNCRLYFRVPRNEVNIISIGHDTPDTVTGELNNRAGQLTCRKTTTPIIYDVVICADCGRLINLAETDDYGIMYNGEYYCENCVVRCYECGDKLPVREARSYDDEYYCESCFDDNFYICDNCGVPVPNDQTYHEDGCCYCEDCYCEIYDDCTGCGCTCERDTMVEIDGEYYCEDCAAEIEEEKEMENTNSTIGISDENFESFKNGVAVIDIGDYKNINVIMSYIKDKGIYWYGNKPADTTSVMLDMKRIITSGIPISLECKDGFMYYGVTDSYDKTHIIPTINAGGN